MKKRINKFIKKMQNKKVFASVIIIALALSFALILYIFRNVIFVSVENQDNQFEVQVEFKEDIIRHPLTGLAIEQKLEKLPQVFGVMIDNLSPAWPHSGLDQAFLVIEAPVEGRVSRYLAFFLEDQEIDKIGPVRSARPYFIDWAQELDAMYVHVGGSPQALDLIASNGVFDLNQFSNGSKFWRSQSREAPHNVYTSTELLNQSLKQAHEREQAPELLYGLWRFGEPKEDLPEQGVGVTVDFAAPTYESKWVYSQETNRYQRYQANREHLTLKGQEIWTDNIAIVVTDVTVIDNVGRREIVTIGQGQGYVLKNGEKIEVTWKKDSVSERLRFFDQDDQELDWNPGVTWIEVVPNQERIEFSE
ncbi:DUF3048 domain-containing protein [Patescibacteria group bacterium]